MNDVNEILNLLSQAYSDPQVAHNQSLRNLLFNSARELEQSRDLTTVAAKIRQSISLIYFDSSLYPPIIEKLLNKLSEK